MRFTLLDLWLLESFLTTALLLTTLLVGKLLGVVLSFELGATALVRIRLWLAPVPATALAKRASRCSPLSGRSRAPTHPIFVLLSIIRWRSSVFVYHCTYFHLLSPSRTLQIVLFLLATLRVLVIFCSVLGGWSCTAASVWRPTGASACCGAVFVLVVLAGVRSVVCLLRRLLLLV